jgi:hypothetical protein
MARFNYVVLSYEAFSLSFDAMSFHMIRLYVTVCGDSILLVLDDPQYASCRCQRQGRSLPGAIAKAGYEIGADLATCIHQCLNDPARRGTRLKVLLVSICVVASLLGKYKNVSTALER